VIVKENMKVAVVHNSSVHSVLHMGCHYLEAVVMDYTEDVHNSLEHPVARTDQKTVAVDSLVENVVRSNLVHFAVHKGYHFEVVADSSVKKVVDSLAENVEVEPLAE